MISHDEAQELHLNIGAAIEELRNPTSAGTATVLEWLEDARATAALLVADTNEGGNDDG